MLTAYAPQGPTITDRMNGLIPRPAASAHHPAASADGAMLPSAQRIFDAARVVVAVGNRATVELTDRLRSLIGATPSAAAEAYQHARYQARLAADGRDRTVYDGVALTIASAAARVAIPVG